MEERERMRSGLSSGLALHLEKLLQTVHLWMMVYSPFSKIAETGFIRPLQGLARSPGFISTCLLQRQRGQWLV